MLDFPASPTSGQLFTGPGGVVWSWDSAKWINGTAASTAAALNNVGRNLIHNSMFNVQQRGNPGWGLNGNYTADRWQMQFSAGAMSVALNPLTAGNITQIGDEAAVTYLGCTFTGTGGAGDFISLSQKMEGIKRFSGKTVTVSFWATASAALKFGVNIGQNVGSGGSFSGGVVNAGQSVTLSTQWARYSLTFTLASSAGWVLGTNGDDRTVLNLWYSSGATNNTPSGGVGVQGPGTINLWGVQLEIGTVATPLEKLDPVTQLQQCQRFYCTFAVNVPALAAPDNLIFPTTMRAIPSPITGGGAGFAATNTSAAAVTIAQTAAAAQTLTFSADL